MKIGEYRILYGRYGWFQSHRPVVVRRFLCFRILKVGTPDITKITGYQEYPLGTEMVVNGRRYKYLRWGKEDKNCKGVAASDTLDKRNARYICDGIDDQVEIQAALDSMKEKERP